MCLPLQTYVSALVAVIVDIPQYHPSHINQHHNQAKHDKTITIYTAFIIAN